VEVLAGFIGLAMWLAEVTSVTRKQESLSFDVAARLLQLATSNICRLTLEPQ
jgi:hypothetical protein